MSPFIRKKDMYRNALKVFRCLLSNAEGILIEIMARILAENQIILLVFKMIFKNYGRVHYIKSSYNYANFSFKIRMFPQKY